MTKVSIIVDAGFFFMNPTEKLGYPYAEMGYFQCEADDLRIFADGSEIAVDPKVANLGAAGIIDFQQFRADGALIGGVHRTKSIADYLLQIESLYDVEVPKPSNFDCIVRFHSGTFRCALVKNRYFKQYDPDPAGSAGLPNPPLRKQRKNVAHAVVINIDLTTGEYLVISRGGQEIWSSKTLKDPAERVEIDIAADDATSPQYYSKSIKGFKFYWVPNQGMPPPVGTGGTGGGGGGQGG